MLLLPDNTVVRWLLRWRRKSAPTQLPLGLSDVDIEGLKHLVASPHWKHYERALNALCEQQASELATGLAHDRYLFACGALTALRRVYTVVDDVLVAATQLKDHTDARTRNAARADQRAASTFVNTPWYDAAFARRAASDTAR